MLHGVPASPGIALGTVVRLEVTASGSRPAPDADALEEECDGLLAAAEAVGRDLRAAAANVADPEVRDILRAQAMMATDPALLDEASAAVVEQNMDAVTALRRAAAVRMDALQIVVAERIAGRATDLEEVVERVAARLLPARTTPGGELPEDAVVVARDLGPAQTAMLERGRLRAFVLEESGATAHTAILARTYGIPAVVRVGATAGVLEDGMEIGVDGDEGVVYTDLDDDLRDELAERAAREARERAERREVVRDVRLTDGRPVALEANVGSAEQARAASEQGARAIGLFRTEFLFLERAILPDEDEQATEYIGAVEAMAGGRVVIRTLDVGGDKPLPALPQPEEANPMLGVRGIRLTLRHPEVLHTQLRAILRASAAGPVGIMFPMVTTLSEVTSARDAVERARAELVAEGQDIRDVLVGVMIETPAAVFGADTLAAAVDFFSIGTNDLLQYTFAADRDNPDVGELLDPLHPALLEAVRLVARAADTHGIPVAVCGESASDPLAQLLLVGLGVSELSMVASALHPSRDNLGVRSFEELQALAERAVEEPDAAAVRAMLEAVPAGGTVAIELPPVEEFDGGYRVAFDIAHPEGLHARPAHDVVELVHDRDCAVLVAKGEQEADAASMLALLALGADTGERIEIRAHGRDAKAVVEDLVALLAVTD